MSSIFGSFSNRGMFLTGSDIIPTSLVATPVTKGQAPTFDVPAPTVLTDPIDAQPGELLEIMIFGFAGSAPVVSPGIIPGVTWIEIGSGSSGNEAGGVWAGIVTSPIVSEQIEIIYAEGATDQVAWIVTSYTGYAEGAGGANAYLQTGSGVFSRGPTSRTMTAPSAEGNVLRAAIGSWGPPTLEIGVTSDHEEVDRIPPTPGENGSQVLVVEGIEPEIVFSYTGNFFPATILAYEVVYGPGGP